MQYNKIPKTDLSLSSITLGTWVLGGSFWGGAKAKDGLEAIIGAIEQGVNCIDTAPIYGNGESERVVGKAIKGRRDRLIIATKCGIISKRGSVVHDLSASSIRNEVEASLRRLQVEYIDIYQCHWPDPDTPLNATFDVLNKIRKEGKIRHIGVSNFGASLLEEACQYAPIITSQDQYSLLDRSIEKELLPLTQNKGIGILAYGPLAGGILTGKYKKAPDFKKADARNFFYHYYEGEAFQQTQKLIQALEGLGRPMNQLAINWVRQQPGVASVLVGCRNAKQVNENLQAVSWALSQKELNKIEGILNTHGHG